MSQNRTRPSRFNLTVIGLAAILSFGDLVAEPLEIGSHVSSIALTMPQLGREKRIWIYLPPDYVADGDTRYPVLYMQDGQDLFDPALTWAGNPYIIESLDLRLRQMLGRYDNWQVDKSLDRLFTKGRTSGVIVVGISSRDGNRTAEYSPWPWHGAAAAEGAQYVEFVVHTLKPYIDENYLTLRGRTDTGIAGGSMGGLLALYAGLKYQNVFSKIAAFSPVLTEQVLGQRLLDYIKQQGKSYPMKIYVDLGSAELNFGPLHPVFGMSRVIGFLDDELRFRHVHGGQHRIDHWSKRFPDALLWLYH